MDVGDILADRYELLEEVGVGGMGRVLRAHDRTLGRPVAIKLLAPHLLGDVHAVAALRDEARRAASVRHPNVVQVLDAVLQDTDQPAIVMEFVDGPSLREVVPADGMELTDALQVIAAVGAGLAAVHAAGIVHRDVTPGNVLLDDGVPRLTDFGVARSAADATQTIRGSVGYLAPEQARGEPVGPEADLYALACLATAVLTGRPPFAADVPVGVVHQHLHKDPPDIRDRRPDVPPAVAATIMAALAKQPGERPTSAASMLQALGLSATGGAVAVSIARADTDVPATTVIAADEPDGPPRDSTRVLAAPVGAASAGAAAHHDDADGAAQHEPDEQPPDDMRRTLLTALAVVAVLAVVAGVLSLFGDDSQPVAAAPESSVTPSAAPSPSPSPSPPATPREAAVAALQELRTLLGQLHDDGDVSDEALEKLDERTAKALDKLQEGELEGAAKELGELHKELEDRVEEGEVAGTAQEAILAQVLEAEAALDELLRSEERQEDDGRPKDGGPPEDAGPPGDRGRGNDDDEDDD